MGLLVQRGNGKGHYPQGLSCPKRNVQPPLEPPVVNLLVHSSGRCQPRALPATALFPGAGGRAGVLSLSFYNCCIWEGQIRKGNDVLIAY
jgi:hypothetical protein